MKSQPFVHGHRAPGGDVWCAPCRNWHAQETCSIDCVCSKPQVDSGSHAPSCPWPAYLLSQAPLRQGPTPVVVR